MDYLGRPYRESDRDGFHHIRAMVYRDGEPVEPREQLLAEDMFGTVVEQGGAIVGAASALDFDTIVRGGSLRCAGVAAVGVLPEHRRSGAGAALMEGAHRQYLDLGFALAALYPFRESWYRRSGYEVCGWRMHLEAPMERFPKIDPELPARQLRSDELGLLEPVYEAFARRYAGMNLRKPKQWERAIGQDKPFAAYAIGDPMEAYLLVRPEWDFWRPLEIRELVWTTAAGYRSALNLIAAFGMNKTSIKWTEPMDSPFTTLYLDQGVSCALERVCMWRLLDVPRCLAAVRSSQPVSFTVEVDDSTIPENSGSWRVETGPDGAEVARSREPGGLTLTIGQLTQALLGHPSLESMLGQGLVSVREPVDARAALAALPAAHVYCLDRY